MKHLFVCVALLLTSCSNLEIKDGEWCADRGITGATCFHDLDTSKPKRRLTKEQWDKERFGMVCAKPQVFADKKSAIETFCQNANICTYEVKSTVEKFSENLKESTK